MPPEPAAPPQPDRARPTILLTGGTGQLGYELRRALAPQGRVVAPSRAELDLASEASIRDRVRALRPSVIVNAGAYTAVDRAESDAALCTRLNADGPRVLAEEAERLGAALVHYSTDYVFDGTKGAPYVESDAPNPLNVYGATKLAGEQAVAAVGGGVLIFRTTWVYGARGTNFLRTMLRLARERTELRVVHDQVGSPTWSRGVAEATALVLRGALSSGDPTAAAAVAPVAGLYHLTAAGATTWAEFAREILAGDPRRAEQRCERVVPIPSAEYPTPARRPAYSVLDNGKLRDRFGLALPTWREQLVDVLEDLGH